MPKGGVVITTVRSSVNGDQYQPPENNIKSVIEDQKTFRSMLAELEKVEDEIALPNYDEAIAKFEKTIPVGFEQRATRCQEGQLLNSTNTNGHKVTTS
jgi:hypothetical protein